MNLDRFHFEDDRRLVVAVAVRLTSENGEFPPVGGAHAAIAYRAMDGGLRLLHLVLTEEVKDWTYTENYVLVEPNLRPETAMALAGLCEGLASIRKLIDVYYDFGFDEHSFFRVQDAQCDLVSQNGLTCSTFVATLFHNVKCPLVSPRGWKLREPDRQVYAKLADEFESDPNLPSERAETLRRHSHRIRVGPLDVASAALEDQLPATFFQCESTGRLVHEFLIRKEAYLHGLFCLGVPLHTVPVKSHRVCRIPISKILYAKALSIINKISRALRR